MICAWAVPVYHEMVSLVTGQTAVERTHCCFDECWDLENGFPVGYVSAAVFLLIVPGVLEPDLKFPLSRDVDLVLLWNVGFCSCAYLATVVSVLNVLTSMAENVSPNPRWVGNFFLSLSCRSFCYSNL